MEKINIKDLQLNIDIIQVLNLFSLKKTIKIDLNGNVLTQEDKKNNIIIYKNDCFESYGLLNEAKTIALKLFENYKPEIVGTICKIKPVINWQNIIDLNKDNMLYFDHQSDGVEIFEDKILEDYGWHANSLGISYRQISEFIEENCDGTLLYYDNSVQFNGFCVVNDIEDVRLKVKNYISDESLKNIKNESIDLEDNDVQEALEYFDIKV